ncbi:ankyrin repeat-containing domain protein [Cladorrhinum samala]|uniref:Ankyrin repeat-containing domain protein n=1 Tax=Cladorrhinum samala TaxID=585594 RepID=A0AAV9I5M1_9PEZI|nr:ankyrin repeat-containing domain protein [Cladorrhinum samala]
MAEITTLAVSHQPPMHRRMPVTAPPPPPPPMQAIPGAMTRMGWKPNTRIPHQNCCRELVKPNRSSPKPTPSVWVHSNACRCAEQRTERESADDALTQAIESISAAYRAKRKQELDAISQQDSSQPSPISTRPRHRSSGSAGLTSTITRLFKLSSHSPSRSMSTRKPSAPGAASPRGRRPTIQEIADICNACADLDAQRVAQYLLPTIPHGTSSSLINTPNHLGITPLMSCLRAPAARIFPKAHLAMLAFLLDCGANPNATTVTPSQGHAPGIGLGAASILTAACALDLPHSSRHGAKVIKLLLDRGAAVDAALPSSSSSGAGRKRRDHHGSPLPACGPGGGQTAIHIATLAGNADALEALLDHGGADVNRVFDAGPIPAAESSWEPPPAARASWKGTRMSLARHRRDDSKDTTTSSSSSSTSSSAKSISTSARSSAEVMMTMGIKNPVTALHLAARGSPACARVLLARGADLNARDGQGRTPMHWAAEFGSVQVVEMLLDAGADADAGCAEEDDQDRLPTMPRTTPLGAVVAALESGEGRPAHVGVARLLIGRGAEVDGNGIRERLLAVDEWKHIFEDILRGGEGVEVEDED